MKLSEKLLAALDADQEYNGNISKDYRNQYPNVMDVYDEIKKMEDNPAMLNYDRWGIPRPFNMGNL